MHNGLTNEITFTHKDRKFVLYPLSPSQVVEDQMQMKNKINKENENSTYVHISETSSNCLSRKHKTFACPSKKVIILRGKDLCENKVKLTFSYRGEKQDQNKPCVEKGNIFKIISIQHKENKKQNQKAHKTKYLYHSFDTRCMIIGSHILWMFISITLILLFGVCCRMVFDPGGGRHKKTKGCCHEETCRFKDRSFVRKRG